MSAYIISKNHAAFLAACAIILEHKFYYSHKDEFKCLDTLDAEGAVNAANMLRQECCKSVLSRYPDCTLETAPTEDGDYTPITETDIQPFIDLYHKDKSTFAPQVLKSIHSFVYQSCEHDGWMDSEARLFCESLTVSYIREIAGYENAEWGCPDISELIA